MGRYRPPKLDSGATTLFRVDSRARSKTSATASRLDAGRSEGYNPSVPDADGPILRREMGSVGPLMHAGQTPYRPAGLLRYLTT